MAFPTIPTGGRVLTNNQADTTATRTFPNLSSLTKNSGDLIIAVIVAYQSSTTNAQFSAWGGSFTEFHDSGTATTLAIGLAYKWSTGSETGTFTVTQAATITGHASMMLLSIPGAHLATPPEAGSRSDNTAAAADPASFDPAGWAAEDTLWIALAGSGETSATGTWTGTGGAAPTNYSSYVDTNTADTSTVGQTEAAVAFRQLNASSEDVGTFASTDISNARNSSLMIAVRPMAVIGPTTEAVGILDPQAYIQDKVFSPGPVGVLNLAELVQGIIRDLPPDNIGITDTANVQNTGGGTSWTVTPVDPVGLLDPIVLVPTWTLNPVDPVGITDTQAYVQDKVSGPDAVGITDAANPVKTGSGTFIDPVGLTDDVDMLVVHVLDNSADPVGISDTAAPVKTIDTSKVDPVGITDTQTVAAARVVAQTDPEGITDAAALTAAYTAAQTDPVGIADTAQLDKFGAGAVAPSDAVGISDSALVVAVHTLSPTDPVGLTDTASVQLLGALAPVDAVGIADTSARAATMLRTITDTLGITDSAIVGIPPTVSFNLTYDPLSPVLARAVSAPTTVTRRGGSPTGAHTKSDPTGIVHTAGTTARTRTAGTSLAHTASAPRLE